MIVVNESYKLPLDDFLAHYGVKGMKWGVRKAQSTSQEIHAARARQDSRLRQLQRESDTAENDPSAARRKAAQERAKKIARDYQTNEDRVVAARVTSGEKVVQAMLLGPLALATIPISNKIAKAEERRTDEARRALEREQGGRK